MNIDKELEEARSAAYAATDLAARSAAWSAARSEETKKQVEIIKEML